MIIRFRFYLTQTKTEEEKAILLYIYETTAKLVYLMKDKVEDSILTTIRLRVVGLVIKCEQFYLKSDFNIEFRNKLEIK